ncbi:MAG TPA: ethanolamine ammonia-lyase reactivating factor EutA [Streptosporangiaceae bacterium]
MPDLADLEHVELETVGIDIGSSTSHLMFSRVRLRREAQGLSSRFVVTGREVRWRSPVILTPYQPGRLIDSAALAAFVGECYRVAGVTPDDVDTGAVILTGEALKRRNARAIADLFAGRGGKFVCASAGHHLEATMAAHGSGSVALSRDTGQTVLHLDIGGGTTKRALIRAGKVTETAAIAAGGRLLAMDGGVASRIEEPAAVVAGHLGIPLALGDPVDGAAVAALAEALAGVVAELATGHVSSPVARELLVTDPPAVAVRPDVVTVSGGVAEYLDGRETGDFGDIAPALAQAVKRRLARDLAGVPVQESPHRIRATVIGASQFSVQVSGSTVDVADQSLLPASNLPVVYPRCDLGGEFTARDVSRAIAAAAQRMDVTGDDQVALAFAWAGDPSYPRLLALAEGVLASRSPAVPAAPGAAVGPDAPRGQPLVLLLSGDVAQSLGRLLRAELHAGVPLLVLDGLDLTEFDYVDIGEVIRPAGVVPVIIKSLLFDAPGPEPLAAAALDTAADPRDSF